MPGVIVRRVNGVHRADVVLLHSVSPHERQEPARSIDRPAPASDAAVDNLQVDVYKLREGKLVRATLAYPDKTTAFEAVGLRE